MFRHRSLNMPWKRKRCWTADALCRLDRSFTPRNDSEQDLGSSRGTDPSREQPSETTKPFSSAISVARDLSSRTARTRVSISISRALRETLLCRADWLFYEELQPRNAQSSPFENSPIIPVQRVRTSQLRGAPLGASVPAGPVAYRRIQLASQIKCLGMGAQAGQTAPAPGEQTVSTALNQISGRRIWKWLEITATSDLGSAPRKDSSVSDKMSQDGTST